MARLRGRWIESGTDLERTVYFSDAVFAIAITLLVLNIRLPAASDEQLRDKLPSLVLGLWPQFLSFIISFLVIGTFWMSHHRVFHYIKRYDGRLLWLNLLFLMNVVFLPFPTSVLSEGGAIQQFSAAFYAGSVAVAGLLGTCIWWYATRSRRLVDDDIDPRLMSLFLLRSVVTPLILGLSIGVSFIDVEAAEYSWALVVLVRWLLPYVLFRSDTEA